MARKKIETTCEKVVKAFIKNILKFISEFELDNEREEILKHVFGTYNIKKDCGFLENLEKYHKDKYIVIPVVIRKNNPEDKELFEELIKHQREIIREIIEELKKIYVEGEGIAEEDDIERMLCVFGDECVDSKTARKSDKKDRKADIEVENNTETIEEKPKRRRGRPRKEKEKKIDNDSVKITKIKNTKKSEDMIPDIDEDEELEENLRHKPLKNRNINKDSDIIDDDEFEIDEDSDDNDELELE